MCWYIVGSQVRGYGVQWVGFGLAAGALAIPVFTGFVSDTHFFSLSLVVPLSVCLSPYLSKSNPRGRHACLVVLHFALNFSAVYPSATSFPPGPFGASPVSAHPLVLVFVLCVVDKEVGR